MKHISPGAAISSLFSNLVQIREEFCGSPASALLSGVCLFQCEQVRGRVVCLIFSTLQYAEWSLICLFPCSSHLRLSLPSPDNTMARNTSTSPGLFSTQLPGGPDRHISRTSRSGAQLNIFTRVLSVNNPSATVIWWLEFLDTDLTFNIWYFLSFPSFSLPILFQFLSFQSSFLLSSFCLSLVLFLPSFFPSGGEHTPSHRSLQRLLKIQIKKNLFVGWSYCRNTVLK